MRKFLSSSFLMPFYGLMIRFFNFIGFLQPIIWLTLYFCQKHSVACAPEYSGSKIKLLALNHQRFRGDLDVLSKTGKFEVIVLPHFWMCRILYAFFRGKPSFESIFMPTADDQVHHNALAQFMRKFLPPLYRQMSIDIVISAAAHYSSDYLWGMNSSKNNTSFVVMHRESFFASEYIRQQKTEFWKKVGTNFKADFLITQTEAARDVFISAGIIKNHQAASAGTLRMDDFIRRYHRVDTPPPDKKQVVLFSFTYAVGVGQPISHWYDETRRNDGFAQMFEDVHAAFAQFARDNPNIHCVIKPKWGGVWIDKIDDALKKNGLKRVDIPNLAIEVDVDVHRLIEQSSVVCGYGSTTLLESIVIGNRPIIIPLLGEIQDPHNQSKIMLADSLGLFDVVYSKNDFMKMMKRRLYEEVAISPELQMAREKLFDQWSSPLNKRATENYTKILQDVVSLKRSISQKD